MYFNKKTKIIIVMLVAVVFMAVGYALLSTNLNIQGTGTLTDSWGIRINSVESTPTGRAYNISDPTYSNTTMTFNVGVKEPGDKMTFTVTVQNYGTLDAILDNIDASSSGSYVIKYGIEGIQEGTRLLAGESITFTITTEFDIDATEIPNDPVKELTVTLNYIQDDGQSLTPSDPNIDNDDTGLTLVKKILRDNQAESDSRIDFSQISSATNGQGLYYTSTNTENNQLTYYFRGAVENNYVQFAGFYWRIIRINEDGSVRLIYQGTTPDATGSAATIGRSMFNQAPNDNAYVGYMYGAIRSSSYNATHANTNDSTIKGIIDTWYEENLLDDYAIYLADSGFCGDRSIYNGQGTGLGYGINQTYYGVRNRLSTNKTPQFACPQSNDLYTTSSSDKGNKSLDYPIGLITADEVAYAGGVDGEMNTSYYLYTGYDYWTMSPGYFHGSVANEWRVAPDGYLANSVVRNSGGSRPVINLVSGIEITGGDGTIGNEYIIKVS